MLVQVNLFYFEINITFWVKKSLTSIIKIAFEIIFCLFLLSSAACVFPLTLQKTNSIFNIVRSYSREFLFELLISYFIL